MSAAAQGFGAWVGGHRRRVRAVEHAFKVRKVHLAGHLSGKLGAGEGHGRVEVDAGRGAGGGGSLQDTATAEDENMIAPYIQATAWSDA